MKIIIKRDTFYSSVTLGKLFIEDNFICFTLEYTCFSDGLQVASAIPEGKYKLSKSKSNALIFNARNKDNITHIKIDSYQADNTDNTDNCILIGMRKDGQSISFNRDALNKLKCIIGTEKSLDLTIS